MADTVAANDGILGKQSTSNPTTNGTPVSAMTVVCLMASDIDMIYV
jgi:hypothetical protein